VRNIAPADPQWIPANPRYVAVFSLVQADLDRDLEPILRQQRAAGEQLLHSLLASHLSDTQVAQLLQFFRTPTGGRYLTFQTQLNRIVSLGLPQAMRAMITGLSQPASPDVGPPALLAERLRVLKLSYFTLLLNSSAPRSPAARTEASLQQEDSTTFVLSAIAAIRGREVDQLRVAYQSDLEHFAAFHETAAMKALFAMFSAPGVPKQAPHSVDPTALQTAFQRSVAMHSASWKTAYDQGRQGHGAPPSTTAVAATAPQASTPSDMDGEFPRGPELQLPSLKTIPSGDEVVLEVGPTTGRLQDGKMQYHAGIRIFDLTRAQAYQWDLPGEVLDGLAPQGMQRASWSPATNELLFANLDQAYLISTTGQVRPLMMQMPGKLKPFDGVETPALSPDGRFISYYLYTRDVGDRQPDGFGRLYVDLMYQRTGGSPPVSLLREVRPSALAWSPDSEKLACGTFDGQVIVLDRSDRQTTTVQIGAPPNAHGILQGAIYALRWNPDGTRIGLVYQSRSNSEFYVVRPDGTDLRQVRFGSADVDLKSFSWSPDGRRLIFRSFFQGTKLCNYSAVGYKFNTGDFPCVTGANLFTSNADGTNLRKISPQPDYSQGELFWIQ
jgi:WD40-like Beta Propeller Repeat